MGQAARRRRAQSQTAIHILSFVICIVPRHGLDYGRYQTLSIPPGGEVLGQGIFFFWAVVVVVVVVVVCVGDAQ